MNASALQSVCGHGACIRGPAEIGSACVGQSYASCLRLKPVGNWRFARLRHRHGSVKCGSGCGRSFEACQALCFQTVTADNDSENSEAAGPSMQSIEFAPRWRGRDELRQFLSVTKHSFHEGLSSLKERGLLQSTKDLLHETKERVESVDVKKVVLHLEQSTLVSGGAALWQSSEPWVKWPIAIFFPLYVLITLVFGVVVSRDLLPLWILGPVGTGLLIRASIHLVGLVSGSFARVSRYSGAVIVTGVQLYRDARSGELPAKVTVYARSRVEELKGLKDLAQGKKGDFQLYVSSGQAATDSKVFVETKSGEILEWATIKYEDYSDWIRPYWRAVKRFFQKIF